MLNINFKYNISSSQWQQFSDDVVHAFDHPIFSALKRVRDPHKVVHLLFTSCNYPSSGRSCTPACGARCSAPAAPRLVSRAVIAFAKCRLRRRPDVVSSVRQMSLSGCFVLLSLPHAYMNDLDIDLDRNTPWVDVSACVKFRLDRPSRLAGHTEQTDKQTDITAFII